MKRKRGNGKTMAWWIKQRDNPQLVTYYTPMGQMTTGEALAHEQAIYGTNTMHRYDDEGEYRAAVATLNKTGRLANDTKRINAPSVNRQSGAKKDARGSRQRQARPARR